METARRDAATWPPHVYVPSAAAGDAAGDALRHTGEQTVRELLARCELGVATFMSAAITMGTWRMTQGIYRIDPDLHPALIANPTVQIPADVRLHDDARTNCLQSSCQRIQQRSKYFRSFARLAGEAQMTKLTRS